MALRALPSTRLRAAASGDDDERSLMRRGGAARLEPRRPRTGSGHQRADCHHGSRGAANFPAHAHADCHGPSGSHRFEGIVHSWLGTEFYLVIGVTTVVSQSLASSLNRPRPPSTTSSSWSASASFSHAF